MGTNLKPTLQKIEEVQEVCTKEYRVPVVRRSIYSPPPELADGASSNNESSIHEDDEESLDVPATSRVIPFLFFVPIMLYAFLQNNNSAIYFVAKLVQNSKIK